MPIDTFQIQFPSTGPLRLKKGSGFPVFLHKGSSHLVPYDVAARPDGRPEGDEDVGEFASEFVTHLQNGLSGNPFRSSPPSGMDRPHNGTPGVEQQEGDTVCRQDAEVEPFLDRDEPVSLQGGVRPEDRGLAAGDLMNPVPVDLGRTEDPLCGDGKVREA